MDYVTEPGDPAPHHVVQKPQRRTDAKVSDFTMMVTVPDHPEAIRVFTAAQDAEAHQYAAETGGTVVPLPLAPPDGYTAGPGGSLVPVLPPTCAGMADLPSPNADADAPE